MSFTGTCTLDTLSAQPSAFQLAVTVYLGKFIPLKRSSTDPSYTSKQPQLVYHKPYWVAAIGTFKQGTTIGVAVCELPMGLPVSKHGLPRYTSHFCGVNMESDLQALNMQ